MGRQVELEELIEVYRPCALGEGLADLELFILMRRGEKEKEEDSKEALLQKKITYSCCLWQGSENESWIISKITGWAFKINNLMNGEAFEFFIWMICLLHRSYLKRSEKRVAGRTWVVILVKDCVTIWTTTQIPHFLCFPGSGEMVCVIKRLEDTGNKTWGPMTKIHFDIHICHSCPELLWSLIPAGACNWSSESSGVRVLCLLAGLIKTSYSSALNCENYASEGSSVQRTMV